MTAEPIVASLELIREAQARIAPYAKAGGTTFSHERSPRSLKRQPAIYMSWILYSIIVFPQCNND